MPWAMETKAGFGWATLVTIIFLLSIWGMVVSRNPVFLLVPIVAFFGGFMAWVNRVK